MQVIKYDKDIWEEIPAKPVNTLQVFITNKCNLRCKGCFYSHALGAQEMTLDAYKSIIMNYEGVINKINILGGEPTLHKDLEKMIRFNQDNKLRTTIYTNGYDLERLSNINLDNVSIRIGVHGAYTSEKPLSKVNRTRLPVTIVYMINESNKDELMNASLMCDEFNCSNFYISSIRDIADTGNYWLDNETTVPLPEYARIINNFLLNYGGGLNEIHISDRGVLKGKFEGKVRQCRFGNAFPNGESIICPLDISLNKFDKLSYNTRRCNKNSKCLLTKIVLRRKPFPIPL